MFERINHFAQGQHGEAVVFQVVDVRIKLLERHARNRRRIVTEMMILEHDTMFGRVNRRTGEQQQGCRKLADSAHRVNRPF